MKTTLTLLLVSLTTIGFSQAGAKWATGGNAAATGDFLGTTNSYPIDFRTNNISRMNLSATGVLKITNLAGIGSRILQVDANGNLISLPAGAANQVLYGNGTWGALPTIPAMVWQTNSFGAYYFGNVGINKSNPQFALDVLGDAKISNNLIVGGGLIISQKVEATNSLKTDTVHSMTGETKFTSKVILKQQFQVDGTSLFNGTVQASNLYVSGATTFANGANVNGLLSASSLNVANNTTFTSGITSPSYKFDALNGINYIPATATNRATFYLGKIIATTPSIGCPLPDVTNVFPQFMTEGGFASVIPLGSGLPGSTGNGANTINSSLSLYSSPLTGSGIIEVGGVDDHGLDNNGLMLNYYCGRNTFINVNSNLVNGGGIVYMGQKVAARGSLKIGNNGNDLVDLSTTLDIYQNPTNTTSGIKLNTSNNALKAFSINNTNLSTLPFTVFGDGKTQINSTIKANKYFVVNDVSNSSTPVESFIVYGDGKTEISTTSTDAFTIKSNYTNDINFKVKSNGLVYAREINVITGAFPDYVFDSEYKLTPLNEVENYISKNKHLKGFDSAKYYEKNGLNVSELLKMQQEKIEELTLYLIEMKKEIENLKKK